MQPFEIIHANRETPVLVEVPHAGTWLDPEAAAWLVVPAGCVAQDADLYVDELFADAPLEGATLISARVSRYVVDLNRGADDYDQLAVSGGPPLDRPRGVIWRLTSNGHAVLRAPLSQGEYHRRMATLHEPYHAAVRRILDDKRRRFGFAVMLCAHSMPSPRSAAPGRPPPQLADIVPGTRGRTSAGPEWIDLVERSCLERGWTVQHDVPYRGGFATAHYGAPAESVHAIQLEIARRLYMNEETFARSPAGFGAVKAFARDLVARLVATAEHIHRSASVTDARQ